MLLVYVIMEYMQKQKIQIKYQKDDTIQTITGLNSTRDPPILPSINTSFQTHLQNGHFSKRNKLVTKRKELKNLIFKHKVNRIQKTFIKKMRLNSVFRDPCQVYQNQMQAENGDGNIIRKIKRFAQKIGTKSGLFVGNFAMIMWSFVNILQITFMVFIFSIMMAFQQTRDFPLFLYFRTFSIVLYVIDMFLNFTVKRYERGKYLQKISQISAFYLKNGFIIDLISILIFPIDVLVNTNITIFISFVAIIKLSNNMIKFQKFQYQFISGTQKQHYYGLVKVFLTNFAIGHFLSIFLNLMAGMNASENWQLKMGITNSPWYVKYAWGYYWGTNIMLTVGFGDIAATNYYQAIVLVFIESVSCITLAYNINYVGALIGSIRLNQEQKKKKLKILHRMCKQNFVTPEMESKVSNFIEESHHIKQSFQYDAYDQVLKSLPKSLQREYRIQANKTIFDSLGFLNNLSKKSLLKLAESVSRKICHPQQIILKKGSISDFLILQKGYLSLTCRIRSLIDGKQIEVLDVGEGSKPKILSLDFIKNKILNYNVKSNRYSVLYYLNREDFMQSLRLSQMDFQLFCMMKDKDDYTLDENNLYECQICKGQYHNKFDCSRLHFIPLKQNIVMKYLRRVNKAKQGRQINFYRNKISMVSMIAHKQLKQKQTQYMRAHFDEIDCQRILELYNFYKKSKVQNNQNNQNSRTQAFQMFKNSSKSHPRLGMDDKTMFRIQQIFQAIANKSNDMCIWDFQIDRAQDFNFYFNQGNPENLKNKKKVKRGKKIQNIF